MTEYASLFTKFVELDARTKVLARARRSAGGVWKSVFDESRLFTDARSMAEAIASTLSVSANEVKTLGSSVANQLCLLMPNVAKTGALVEEFTDRVVERLKGADWDTSMSLVAELLCLLEGVLAVTVQTPSRSG